MHNYKTCDCRYPNNPDGVKRQPLVEDPDRIITDLAYYWPIYTNIDKKFNTSMMVFSRQELPTLRTHSFNPMAKMQQGLKACNDY